MKVNIMRLPDNITEFGKTDSYSILLVVTRAEAEAFVRDVENNVSPSAPITRMYEMMRAMAEGAGSVALYNSWQHLNGG